MNVMKAVGDSHSGRHMRKHGTFEVTVTLTSDSISQLEMQAHKEGLSMSSFCAALLSEMADSYESAMLPSDNDEKPLDFIEKNEANFQSLAVHEKHASRNSEELYQRDQSGVLVSPWSDS